METTIHVPSSSTVIIKVAALTASGLVAFFLIMRILELHTIVQLRFFNLFILLFGIRYALLQRRKSDENKLGYLPGLMLGFSTAMATTAMFSIFIFIYLNIDRSFMNFLVTTQPMGNYLTPASTALETLLEGSSSGAIITLLLMHLFNRDTDAG